MKKLINEILFGTNARVSGVIALAIVGLIALGCTCGKDFNVSNLPSNSSSNPNTENVPGGNDASNLHKTGEDFSVGYMQYKVFDSYYTDTIHSNPYLNEPPNAKYLFVEVGVRNLDKEERTVPPFKLIDETGAEYGTSDRAWAAENSMGLIQNLNPGVSKSAYVIFDVPEGRSYKLKVSGGYWSTEDGLVELAPKSAKSGKKKK